MISTKSSINGESFTCFEAGHCNDGRISVESPIRYFFRSFPKAQHQSVIIGKQLVVRRRSSPCNRFFEIVDIVMHYFLIETQWTQLHDNGTHFMHYNAYFCIDPLQRMIYQRNIMHEMGCIIK
jgi:hypothetical protein